MSRKKIIFGFLAALAPAILCPAGHGVFEVLQIGVGAVSTAMGGSGAAVPGSLEGVFRNPASLASMPGGVSALGSFNPYLDMSLWSAALSFTAEKKVSLAFAVYGLSYGSFTGDITYNGDPGRLLKTGDMIASLGAALPLGGWWKLPFVLDIGLNAKVASQVLDDTTLAGLLFDAGILAAFRAGRNVMSLGFCARQIGSILDASRALALPTALTVGAAWRFAPSAAFSLKVQGDGEWSFASSAPSGVVGVEVGFLSLAFLRGGYVFGAETAQTRGITMGMGARLRVSKLLVRVDYAVVPLGDLGSFQHNIQLGFSINPGPSAIDANQAVPTKPLTGN